MPDRTIVAEFNSRIVQYGFPAGSSADHIARTIVDYANKGHRFPVTHCLAVWEAGRMYETFVGEHR